MHTVVKARQTAEQRTSLGVVAGPGDTTAGFQSLELPLILELFEGDWSVRNPEVSNGLDPARIHRFDVRPVSRDMSVFLGKVFANEEVRHVADEVVLVNTPEFLYLVIDISLDSRVRQSERGSLCSRIRALTRWSGGMPVQQTTMPWRGFEDAAASSVSEGGGESIPMSGEGA